MRSLVAVLVLAGCSSPGGLCSELSTSPDGRYRLESRADGDTCRGSGFVVLRDLQTGRVIDQIETASLDLRGKPGWWTNAVDFEIRERGIWEMVTVEKTFELP